MESPAPGSIAGSESSCSSEIALSASRSGANRKLILTRRLVGNDVRCDASFDSDGLELLCVLATFEHDAS